MRRILIAAALTALAGAAQAQSYKFCLTCTGPERIYICDVAPSEGEDPGKAAMRLFCVFTTARQEDHKTCSARDYSEPTCQGATRLYRYARVEMTPQVQEALMSGDKERIDEVLARATRNAVSDTVDFVSRSGRAVGTATKRAREAVGDAAGATVRGAEDSLEKTGERVGSAADKTREGLAKAGECLRSLFRKCW